MVSEMLAMGGFYKTLCSFIFLAIGVNGKLVFLNFTKFAWNTSMLVLDGDVLPLLMLIRSASLSIFADRIILVLRISCLIGQVGLFVGYGPQPRRIESKGIT